MVQRIGTKGNDQFDTEANGGSVGPDTLKGLGGDDILKGLGGIDLIRGGSGQDDIDGGDGNDELYGDSGDDIVAGGAGADRLFGGKGEDNLSGGSDNDYLDGGRHNDTLAGDDGDDTIEGGRGSDSLSGGLGNDRLFGGRGADTIAGNDGNDSVFGGRGHDDIAGGNGDDRLEGGGGNDSVLGGAGNDFLDGDDGDDLLDGGDGNDTIVGSNGNNTLNGGSGFDTLDYSTLKASLLVDMTLGTSLGFKNGVDTFSDFEAIQTGRGNDTILGSWRDERLGAGDGTDSIDAGDGDDTLVGGLGNDTLNGGAGVDRADYAGEKSDIVVDVDGGIVTFNDGSSDSITAIEGFLLGSGNDVVKANATTAFVDGGAGHDLITDFGGGNSEFRGGTGRDSLNGMDGNDTLNGGDEDDVIEGGNGDDLIIGGRGADLLAGGSGEDTFDLGVAAGSADRITDFTVGVDKLKLTDSTLTRLILGQNFFYAGDAGLNNAVGPHIIYDRSNGELRFDADGGSGATSTLIARIITGGYDVTVADFILASSTSNGEVIHGGVGNDTMSGGTGNDTFDGGDGIDTFDLSLRFGNISADATAGTFTNSNGEVDQVFNFENYLLGSGNDTFSSNRQTQLVNAGAGNDSVNDAVGSDNRFEGGAGDDTLDGGLGKDLLFGGDGVDFLIGGGGNDTMFGEAGADTLDGGAGQDYLSGGLGDDLLTGGDGNDTFVLATGSTDAITDFLVGTDKLDISALRLGSLSLGVNFFLNGNNGAAGVASIQYDARTGNLVFDADGIGSGAGVVLGVVQFAGLPVTTLAATDFIL